MPEVPPAAEVEDDTDTSQRVTEQAGQQGRANQRVILALVEDVHQHGHREAAAGEGRPDDNVNHDPDTPRITVVKVSGGTEAEQEAHGKNRDHDRDQNPADQGSGVEHLPADRGRRMICVTNVRSVWSVGIGSHLSSPLSGHRHRRRLA